MSVRRALTAMMLAPVAALAQPAALSPAEKTGFAGRVESCWTLAQGVDPRVTLRFAMTPDGRPVADSFVVVGTAAQTAFEAARRAVLRCARAGYDLPKDRYDAWDLIEITFTADGIGAMS
ncbi:hypothetical protein [Paracoccus sp. S1E-3]|uniref:hypothetical protein n=1 Tax=Paracoccus sp. S1E-3 TaxID=2756130 RepID=UPI0015EE646F|nr:hypothetical protein [Paracoccus sp. S1E-3]MBA4492340.1 hypothetical protein [Paracoccus sp. S1E-3]